MPKGKCWAGLRARWQPPSGENTTPCLLPHADTGDGVVVINADKIVLTGRKWQQKNYYRHSGYIGGLTTITAEKLLEKRPEDIVRFAVKGDVA